MYHIAICDDEKQFAMQLKELIIRYANEVNTDIKVSYFSDGVELTKYYPMDIDLIFLDIQMAQMDGLQSAKAIREIDSKVSIIFLTSMAQYALEGYKYNATNFVIKPLKYVRLKEELDRWRAQYSQDAAEYILISNDTGKYKVFINSLLYIETFGRNLMIHTENENIMSYKKMREFEIELPAASFVRCHTSYLVNLYFVKRAKGLEIELTNNEIIPISQLKRKAVMEELAQYWGDRL